MICFYYMEVDTFSHVLNNKCMKTLAQQWSRREGGSFTRLTSGEAKHIIHCHGNCYMKLMHRLWEHLGILNVSRRPPFPLYSVCMVPSLVLSLTYAWGTARQGRDRGRTRDALSVGIMLCLTSEE